MGSVVCSGCCQERAMLFGDAQSFFTAPTREGPGLTTNTHTSASSLVSMLMNKWEKMKGLMVHRYKHHGTPKLIID